MSRLSSAQITDAIRSALASSGASSTLKRTGKRNPRKLYVHSPEGSFELWVYVWTLTPGGRPSLPDEYRIQMTTVTSPLPLNPNGPTLLLGYESGETGYFAGFDLGRHITFTEGSSSVQIPLTSLKEAQVEGLAFSLKENGEIAVGIRPDQLLTYCLTASELHEHGAYAAVLETVSRAMATGQVDEVQVAGLTEDRKRVVRTISALSRASTFRSAILEAYGSQCAFTGIQLGLIEAAHILPVAAQGSNDLVSNGIAASPTCHRAFDSGLIYLAEDYTIHIDPLQESELRLRGQTSGLKEFKELLQPRLILPSDPVHHPDVEMIRLANEFRGISEKRTT